VQHAHQKGIIHRDLKPSNILVTHLDDRPIPKVIDFGIAKATGPTRQDRIAFTRAHMFIGTPAYMSPEQTLQGGADVDTRSDIYSLGVLLYELLTGQTPFNRESLSSAGYAEVQRLIRETDPPWPSQRVSRIGAAERSEIARRRGLEPAQLKRRLRGDLDRVVMKCLEKDRTRRYETVNGLAMDVQRHLRHEPVLARPDTMAYRTWKFVRRRRAPVSVGLALLLALLAGLAGTLTQARRAMHASALAAAEAASSRAVNDFLQQDLLEQANPENELSRDLTLRTVLDRAAQRIEGRFTQQPLIEADLRQTLATTYVGLGEFALARGHWERAHALRTQYLGADDPVTLRTASSLADALRLEGVYADAEQLAADVLARQRRILGSDHPNTISTINNLGLIHSRQGRYAESEALFAEAFARRKRVSGPEHSDTLAAMHNLAGAYLDVGRDEEGERLSLETLSIVHRIFGADHPHTLMTLNNLAQMYLSFGNAAEAEEHCAQALAGRQRVLGPEHPLTLVSATTLARIYAMQGKLAEAEALNRQILTTQRHKLGPDHPDALITMNNLGTVYRDLGRFSEAEQWHAETWEKLRQVLGPEHRFTLNSRGKLVGVYCDQKRWAAAELLGLETLELCERVLGPSHPYSIQAQRFLGLALLRRERPAEAEPFLRRALTGAAGQAVSWSTATTQAHLGEALLLLERLAEAESFLLEANRHLRTHAALAPPADRGLPRQVAHLLAELYRTLDRPGDATTWARVAADAEAAY
jgi:eukaryotic-like serine/threonine-protein kinase